MELDLRAVCLKSYDAALNVQDEFYSFGPGYGTMKNDGRT